jgi:hypothetical protein
MNLTVSLAFGVVCRQADLFTVLVCYNRSTGRSRISPKADTFLLARGSTSKLDSYNGSTSRSGCIVSFALRLRAEHN